MQLWSAAQELPIADHQLGEMPKFRAQLYGLTNTSLWVVNSASFFLLSGLVSVLTCLSVMSPLHLLSRVSPQLDFSPLTSFVGGGKWVSTDLARLHRSTSCERIWLPVSFPFKFSKSHRLCVLLHIQATRKKKKKEIKHNSAIYKGHIAIPPSASSRLFEGWRLQGDFQTVMYHPYVVSILVVVLRQSQPLLFNSNVMFDC